MIHELAARLRNVERQAAQKQVTWGQIIDTSPVTVRFAGDISKDAPIGLKDSSLTFTTGDKVLLIKTGSQWVIVCKLSAT